MILLSSCFFLFAMASYFQESQIIANPIGIQDLPIEILANIGKFLPPPDAVKLGSSSSRMNGALDMILKDSISYVADSTNFKPWESPKHYKWGGKACECYEKIFGSTEW
jgi:hypothetical protein